MIGTLEIRLKEVQNLRETMGQMTVPRIGSLIYTYVNGGTSYFAHKNGLVKDGQSNPPHGLALHLDGCECGQPRRLMTVTEYETDCREVRLTRDPDLTLPDRVTKSAVGMLVAWPHDHKHPLVCLHAAGQMEEDTESDFQVENATPRCACWEYDESYDVSNLKDAFLIFADFPDVKGFDPASHALVDNEIVELDSGFNSPPGFNLLSTGVNPDLAIFERVQQGEVHNLGPTWRHIDIEPDSRPLMDVGEPHLVILDKNQAADAYPNISDDNPLKKPLKFILRRFHDETWMTIDGTEFIPVLFAVKGADPARKVALSFDQFDDLMGGMYTPIPSRKSHRGRPRRPLECTLFHDRPDNNHVSQSNPLVGGEPCYLQIAFSHRYQESLAKGDTIRIRTMDIYGNEIEVETLTIERDGTTQIWVRRPDGFGADAYRIVAEALSEDFLYGRGTRVLLKEAANV